MASLLKDVRYGLRVLRGSPGITLVAVLSLALGIGANVANFTVANAVLFRPLPVEEPDRLVFVATSYKDAKFNPSSYIDYKDLRQHGSAFSGLAAHFLFPMGLKGQERAEVVMGDLVTANYFDVLGVQPVIGRGFLPEEEVEGGPLVAVLSHRFWETRLGSDPDVIGTKILLNSNPFEVIGVAPRGFHGVSSVMIPDVWVPATTVRRTTPYPISLGRRDETWLAMFGRLRDGVTVEQAQAALDTLAVNRAAEFRSHAGDPKSFTVVQASRNKIGLHEPSDQMQQANLMVLGLVGLVLLIACFNVANLLLARASERRKEIATRLALGASRWRIVRQLLTESLLLSIGAGTLGVVLSLWGVDMLLASVPDIPTLRLEIDASADVRVLAFTLLLAVGSGVLFGLAPALQLLRRGQTEALKDQAQSVTPGRERSRVQTALVVAQVAVAVVLLVSAGLFMRSLDNALEADPGFDLKEGLIAEIDLSYGGYEEAGGRAFFEGLLERARTLPGVASAALAMDIPLSEMRMQTHVEVAGYDPPPGDRMAVRRNTVTPGYFATLGIPLIQGRGFTYQDSEENRRVAVVNETMAQRYWGGKNPIGGAFEQGGETWEVIGVARDGRYDGLNEQPTPYVCFPMRQSEYFGRSNLVVRTAGPAAGMLETLRAEVQRLDPNLPAPRILTIEQFMKNAVDNAGGPGNLVSIFGLLALTLAMIGVYGVMAYGVSRRKQEFGIRLALGAPRDEVLGSVMRRGLRMALTGLAIGLMAAAGVARLIEGFLFEVGPMDWVSYAGASLVLMVVAAVACYVPARGAAKVSPARVLRYE